MKHHKLRKSIDILAWFFIAYPFLLFLCSEIIPGPVNAWWMIAALCMLSAFPAILWLATRYKNAPRNTYPLADKFFADTRFRYTIIFGFAFFWFVLSEFVGLVVNLHQSQGG